MDHVAHLYVHAQLHTVLRDAGGCVYTGPDTDTDVMTAAACAGHPPAAARLFQPDGMDKPCCVAVLSMCTS